MDDIRLREHSSVLAQLTAAQVAFLRGNLTNQVTVLPTEEPGRYEIQSGSHVGFVALPEGRVLIVEPKVQIDTLFALLARVYDPSRKILRDEPQGYTTVQGLFEFVVKLFFKHVEDILTRGLLRGYQSTSDNLVAIRGRLLLPETLRQRPGLHDRHACKYSVFTADIPENRILQSAIFALQAYPFREHELSTRLRRISVALSQITPEADARHLFRRLTYHRLNEYYRPALALARLLLDHLTLSGRAGPETFLCFLIDMNWLFEAYVSSVLQEIVGHWGMQIAIQEVHSLDEGHQLSIRPDMILEDANGPCLVLDAKYKLHAHLEDIYQMIAYCHPLNLRRAVLIHPASESAPTGQIVVRGDPTLSIFYLPLDVSGSPAQLATHIQDLAQALAHTAFRNQPATAQA